jgi:hypothetical protein
MAVPTILTGLVLIILGLLGYLNATPNEVTGKVSPTALIPAGIGAVILLCGLLALKANFRKHAMHLAAVFGVLGFLGGFAPIIRQQMKGNPFDLSAPAVYVGVLMSVVCFAFVALCVKSFVDARRARKAAGPAA